MANLKGDNARERWIAAGLAELAKGGVERVRVEVLAKDLGVTKGGFYWHFKDRRALLDAILETWTHGRIAVIEEQTELRGEKARERIKSLISLYSKRLSAHGIAIELAIRQWARSDKAAAKAAAKVDEARLRRVTELYRKLGYAAEPAAARAFMFYTFTFGQSLLFLDGEPGKRESLTAASVRALTEMAKSGPQRR